MQDTTELFDNLLAAYRSADDPDRFLREFLMRLDDATANAVVAAERKLDRLDAARARLEAARQIPRPDVSENGAEASQNGDEAADDRAQDDPEDAEEAEAPKKRKPKASSPA